METSNAIEQTAQPAPPAGADGGVTQNYTRLHTLAGATVQQIAQTATLVEPELHSGLTQRQLAAIELLLLGKSDGQAAQTLGITRKTVWNWRHESDPFKEELHKRRQALWAGIVDRMRSMLDPSLDVLHDHLTDSLDKNRYRAAVAVLRLSNVRQAIPVTEETAK